MKNALLTRLESDDQGTRGDIITNASADKFFTNELPWRDVDGDGREGNASNVSCIPDGVYICKITKNDRMTKLFGKDLYEIQNVPNRSGCFIHPGNWAGDVSKGFKSDVEGCILLGLSQGELSNQKAVIESRGAVKAFMALMGGEDFELAIVSAGILPAAIEEDEK